MAKLPPYMVPAELIAIVWVASEKVRIPMSSPEIVPAALLVIVVLPLSTSIAVPGDEIVPELVRVLLPTGAVI
jgi:hypothetical protein